MSATLASRYDPKEAENRWYEFWETNGYFHAETDDRPRERRYTIVIPPPNVTGALHMGHALNNTLQDILIRWRRMQGFNTLWMPGTDHAGIATQAVVERRIREQEGKTRRDLGRDELVRRIWAWKDDYEQRILNQLRKLGCSCDWQRTRFTFDEGCSRAVRETFFKMFRDGLIYRGKRLVNWDTQLQTSVADDETYAEDVKSGFWTFKYPLKSSPHAPREESRTPFDVGEPVRHPHAEREGYSEFLRFSTTRPETMLGDTAVAVHPNDPRYKHLIGRTVVIPIAGNREIPVIADGLLVDPELGTGCVKVTPAHDPNDYACWQRHQGKPDEIGIINILNPDGTINESCGKYAGLDGYKARDAVTADMEALGLFDGREDRMIPLKFSDRSKSPIEPLLSDQWFVRMGRVVESGELRVESEEQRRVAERDHASVSQPSTLNPQLSSGLAEMAMAAVRDGRVKIHPERYAKTYLDWLGEKRDWCISRQLWWGHRIPVWSRDCRSAAELGPCVKQLNQDPDVKSCVAAFQVESDFDLENSRKLGGDRARFAELVRPEATIHVCVLSDECGIVDRLESEFEQMQDDQGEKEALYLRSEDVLDTWFSSQLWPHSTLGWPERTRELEYYYPTSVLVTTRDIITLWVARMVIAGLYNCGEVPFRDVYITPKILDGFGQTMSKSKGNGVDPLDIIDKYGADALRFGIATMTTESQDARLPVGYECPFCQTYIAQKLEHQQMKPKAHKPDAQARDAAHKPDAQVRDAAHKPDAQVSGAAGAANAESPSLALRVSVIVKPRIKCPSCKKDFQFSSPNFDPDPGEPVARMVSERFEPGRNFANKLWNAARFVLMNLEAVGSRQSAVVEEALGSRQSAVGAVLDASSTTANSLLPTAFPLADEERWILSRLAETITRTTEHLEVFRFSEVAKTLYDFAWSDFCDWYVEMAKLRLRDPATRPTAQRVLATVLDHLLRLLHPIMPFVTEHIWQALGEVAPKRILSTQYAVLGGQSSEPDPQQSASSVEETAAAPSVMIAAWPVPQPDWRDAEVESRMNRLQELIRSIRNIRSNFNVDPKSRVAAHVRCSAEIARELLAARPFIEQLASVDSVAAGPDVTKPADSASAVAADWELYVPLTGLIDRPAEIERNRKLLQTVAAQLKSNQSKLGNAEFVAKAPPDVVEQHRQREAELLAQLKSIEQILRDLGGTS